MLSIFKKRPKPGAAKELIEVLRSILEYLTVSEDSIWSEMGVQEIRRKLSSAIEKLEHQKAICPSSLKYLFAPTGPLQETAMANEWFQPYIELSNRFDKIIEQWS